ncbi:hypothetical protein [Halalkalibacterium ligniniphilum]|uniref:hypothetical protein n=1 Tax=Halalkalibacterium ligniniphilum TaxID=1134413 RepID=UPI0003475781|nr:hypothetical protein [Halalkalibacterium ligniniphilum]
MLGRIITFFSFVLSIYVAYRYRYRMLNLLLGRRFLRQIAVSLAMQIPFIRDNVMGSMLRYERANKG